MLGFEFPPFKSGGLGTYLYGFTKALNERNHNVTFIMPRTGKKIKTDFVNIVQAGSATRFIELQSVLTPYIGSPKITKEGFEVDDSDSENVYGFDFLHEVKIFTYQAVKSGLRIESDVIHCHDWMTFPAGMILKDLTKKPLILTIHSTEYDRTGQLNPNETIRAIEKEGLLAADRIITISNMMKKQLIEKYGISAKKIRVVYNAIDLDSYEKQEIEKPDEKIVLFVGRLTIQKGCEFFLRAAQKVLQFHPNVRFLIVGTGDLMPQLIQLSIDLGIASNVSFTGFEKDVQKYYSVADVFVMPSVSEPFGLTALEASACNAPVIMSKQSGVSEIFKHAMKVDFWDVDELANKILGSINYASLQTELAKNGLEEVQSYSWLKVADECVNVYREVV